MARYQPTKAQIRGYFIDACKNLYGDRCAICSIDGDTLRKKYPTGDEYRLEHRNNDPKDYSLPNIQITCFSCNQRKRPDFQGNLGKVDATTGNTVSVDVKEEGLGHARRNDGKSDLGQSNILEKIKEAPLEMQKSLEWEPKIRRYLWENVGRPGDLFRVDAEYESAEYVGCSPTTAVRYIRKAVSRVGPFRLRTLPSGEEIIELRERYAPHPASITGKTDLEMMERILTRSEDEIAKRGKQLEELNTENLLMREQLQKVANERDKAIDQIANSKGVPRSQVRMELEDIKKPSDDTTSESDSSSSMSEGRES